jgi:hypothetical protein
MLEQKAEIIFDLHFHVILKFNATKFENNRPRRFDLDFSENQTFTYFYLCVFWVLIFDVYLLRLHNS